MGLLGRRDKLWEENRRSMANESCLVRFVMKSEVESPPSIRVVRVLHFWYREGDIFTRGNFLYNRKFYALFLELFPCLLVVNGLYLRIIYMPKRYILGRHTPVPPQNV